MTQPVIQQPEVQPPAICPICFTWSMMPYATRHTTPIPAQEALGIMAAGFWLCARGAKESDLCPHHAEMLIRLDFQKHTREEWERTEKLRIEQEAEAARIEAARPKYPTQQHANIAATLLQRLGQVNPPPNPQPLSHPAIANATSTPDNPNTFPCPDCKKPIRNGQVHACAGAAGQ